VGYGATPEHRLRLKLANQLLSAPQHHQNPFCSGGI